MIRRFPYLVRIRGNRDRQLIISGSILAVICVALVINLTIMLTKNSLDENKKPINNETNETISNKSILSTTVIYPKEKFLNHSFPNPEQYKNYSCTLGNVLYFSFLLLSNVDGFVVAVHLRLFSEWKGHAPLYLFVISFSTSYQILRRYPVNPQRNTTKWQTINIPSNALPIITGDLFGIGMHENSTNQIYAVEATYSFVSKRIHENTTDLNEIEESDGVAFSYTVLHYW